MRKILAICLCLCMVMSCFTCIAHAENMYEINLTSSRYGHIYTDAGQSFQIDIRNTKAADFNGVIRYSVASDGNVIYTTEKPATIASGAAYTDYPVLDLPKYGIFELTATVTDGVTVFGTDTITFSYINASDANEGSQKMFVNTHLHTHKNGDKATEAIRDAGFGGMRDTVYWFQVEEYNKNEYKMPEHTESIKVSAKMGMEPLVVLSGGNGPWGVINEAEGNLNMAPSTTEQINAFAAYCAYVARELKGYVKHYEIWNEFTMPSNGGDQSPEAYAKILVAASEAIKAVDADAKIIAMCTAGIDNTFIRKTINALKSMGKSNCYDIVSVHPYTYGTTHGVPTSSLSLLKMITNKPIWFTERGWDTATSSTESSKNGISDRTQAIYGVKDYLTLVSNNYCERWFWYDFQDDGTNHALREENYGLIESVNAELPGGAKPAYVAFAALNKLVGQSTYKSKSTSGNATAYCFTNNDGEDVYAITGNVGNTITISMTAPKIELMDMYSNVVNVYDNTSGKCTVTLTEEIMYVRKHYEPASCSVTVSGEELLVSGYSMESDQQVSVLVTSAQGEFIYAGQNTCDDERAYSFTANRKGINELYVRVNYGDLFSGDIETGIVLKLMCNDKRIFSIEEIKSTDNLKLLVSVNDAITASTNVHVAVYDGIELKSYSLLPLNAGTTPGTYSVNIQIENVAKFDKISGLVWENMIPVEDKVDFK